ncbi:Retrovirus-related Pol polyprotein from transposon 17.6, partial [Mucuna pruriens]
MKLHATRIIYPFSDIQWASPIQVVLKKSRMTVMKNHHDELVPMRDCMEVFMDDFMVYANSFDTCLGNLSRVLTRFIDANLVLNFEKFHFMVIEKIVLGHLVSSRGIKVDKSKINIITSLPYPAYVWEVRSFFGHVEFYRRFIKNFRKIALPLSKLLQKDELKKRLTSAPILQAPNWEYLFKLMCDASNLAFRAVLGQRVEVSKKSHFLVKKPDAKPTLIQWMLLLQEFDIEIRDKKGAKNSIANHLSRIEKENDPMSIRDDFPDEQLLQIDKITPWFADIYNYIVASKFPLKASRLYKEKIESDAKYYIWDDPYLWRLWSDQVIRRCILDSEI